MKKAPVTRELVNTRYTSTNELYAAIQTSRDQAQLLGLDEIARSLNDELAGLENDIQQMYEWLEQDDERIAIEDGMCHDQAHGETHGY